MKKIYLALCATFALAPAFSQTYNGGGGPINDVATSDFPLVISGLSPATIDSLNFGLETVCVNLTHTWDADLSIYIIAPDGTSAMLESGLGGSDDNFTNTCFNQYATASIINGTAPFTGTFSPMSQMGIINNGQVGNGTWVLRVVDSYGGDSGNMLGWSITFGNNPATATPFTDSNLPIVVINTNNQPIPDEPKIMCDFGIIYNGIGVRNHMTDPMNNYNGKAGIETRGSSSQGFPKKPFGIELWDVNGNAIDSSLVEMPKESDWILYPSYSDKSLMNNFLTYDLCNQMGWYAPRCRHVEVVVNNQYQGVYVLMEKIKRDKHRVDISKLQPTDISGDQLTGGYIIKIDKNTGNGGGGWYSTFAPDTAISGQQIYFQYDYPSDVDIVPQQQAYIQAYVDSFETALAGPNFMDTTIGYSHFIDRNSLVDYFLINEVSKNVDGYRLSTYLYKNKASKGGKLIMGPPWDYDLAYANADYCNGSTVQGWAIDFAASCPYDGWQIPFWWDRLMQDSTFTNRLQCRWTELRQTIYSFAYLDHFIDSMATYLDESQQRNFVTWPILGTYVWPNPSPIPTTYQGEIDELKTWLHNRILWMDANMPGTLNGCNLSGVQTIQSPDPGISTYPNPFSNTINLSIYLPKPQPVQMELLNVMGQTVQPIETQEHGGGTQTLTFTSDANLPAGIYLLRITAGNHTWTKQVVRGE